MSVQTAETVELPLSAAAVDAGPAPTEGRPRSPLLVLGLVLVGLAVAVAVFAPLLTRHDPSAISGKILEQPSARHWLGTDVPGRDIFAQLLYGARASLIAGVVAGSLAILGAIVVGVLPALLSGYVDTVSNRAVVFMLALPGLPLLVLIGSLAGNSDSALILVIGFLGIAPNARIMRSQALTLRNRGFIAASRGFGGGPLYVLRRHLVPGLGPLILVSFVNWVSVAIGLQAGLAFIGLGDPSGISWGLMINRALSQPGIYFSPMWVWWVLPPGFAITLTLLGFTFIGVSLEPYLNPRWMRSK
ncbi:MAG: ABC transporter permease [Actinomycetota bacterium]|nr:ABC transporter permease [Actinomycetota bacterium]